MTQYSPIVADLNLSESPYVGRLANRLVMHMGNEEIPSTAPGWDLISEVLSFAASAEQTIAQQRERISELEALSFTDELTGLDNRRSFRAFMTRNIAQARRHGEQGVVGFFDLDDFKRINDEYGHAAGDKALGAVSKTLVDHLRPSDMAARLGGDEFAVVLARCCEQSGIRRLRSIQAMLDELIITIFGEPVALRASLGYKVYGPCTHIDDLMLGCDSAMYANKAARRKS